ncbi:MAG TPA: hypothetical protein PLZ55_03475 [bacterium]|nr:hypothetical protein [bacterium]
MLQLTTIAYCIILVALFGIQDGISADTKSSKSADMDVSSRCRLAVAEWAEYVGDPKNIADPTSSRDDIYTKNKYFQAIMDLGVPALDSLVEQMKEDSGNYLLEIACREISKRIFVLSPSEFARVGGYRGAFIKWWHKDREKIGQEFAERYGKWKALLEGEEKLQAYYRIRHLGVLAMPYAIENVRAGDDDMLDAIDFWTDNAPKNAFSGYKGEPVSRKDFYLAWWEENKGHWRASPVRRN